MSLTVEDRLQIHQLYARWCALLDAGDHEGWSDCFTEGGIFDGFSVLDGTPEVCRGRAEIAAKGKRILSAAPARALEGYQHCNANILVEGDGRRASGLCYLLHVGRSRTTGEPKANFHAMYIDHLEKVDERWLIASRRISADVPDVKELAGFLARLG